MKRKLKNKEFDTKEELLQMLFAGLFIFSLFAIAIVILCLLGADGQSRLPWQP